MSFLLVISFTHQNQLAKDPLLQIEGLGGENVGLLAVFLDGPAVGEENEDSDEVPVLAGVKEDFEITKCVRW